jgi:hypothetical protein
MLRVHFFVTFFKLLLVIERINELAQKTSIVQHGKCNLIAIIHILASLQFYSAQAIEWLRHQYSVLYSAFEKGLTNTNHNLNTHSDNEKEMKINDILSPIFHVCILFSI